LSCSTLRFNVGQFRIPTHVKSLNRNNLLGNIYPLSFGGA
jgi:hypothetical protein